MLAAEAALLEWVASHADRDDSPPRSSATPETAPQLQIPRTDAIAGTATLDSPRTSFAPTDRRPWREEAMQRASVRDMLTSVVFNLRTEVPTPRRARARMRCAGTCAQVRAACGRTGGRVWGWLGMDRGQRSETWARGFVCEG